MNDLPFRSSARILTTAGQLKSGGIRFDHVRRAQPLTGTFAHLTGRSLGNTFYLQVTENKGRISAESTEGSWNSSRGRRVKCIPTRLARRKLARC